MSKVTLYTDGACRGNPGPGGWGVQLTCAEKTKDLFGGAAHTTNNRMEMTAAIEGLRALRHPCDVVLYTDSRYVLQGMTEWLEGWKARGWKTASKKSVKNQDLWEALDAQVARHTVRFVWVKGHSGDAGNEAADALANRGIDELLDEG